MRFILAAVIFMCGVTHPVFGQVADIEAFIREPHLKHARLSPDGQRLAFTTERDGDPVLVVIDLRDGGMQAADISHLRSHGLRWVSDQALLLNVSDIQDFFGLRGVADRSALIAFDVDDNMDARQLLTNNRNLSYNLNTSVVVGIDPEEHRVLIPVLDDEREQVLLSVDPLTGSVRTIGRGLRTTQDWLVDSSGDVLARIDYDNRFNRLNVRVADGRGWLDAGDEARSELPPFSLAGVMPDGRAAVTSTASASRTALYELSLENGEIEDVIYIHDTYDLDGVVTDPYTNTLLGVYWQEDYMQTHWFDDEFSEIQSILEASLPNMVPHVRSWSEDRSRILVVAEGPDHSPVYYLFDRTEPSLSVVGQSRPEFGPGSLPARIHIRYSARDGESIEAYLTQPSGDGPFPTVVLPHGGPEARDNGGFDAFAHYLAAHGYAVIQPNFRGSSGYGRNWVEGGHGEWGRGVMQHDVTDAVHRLVEAGIADPGRVCIVGASYGGYAALAGAAFTPDLYACSVSIAGVSDIEDMLSYTQDRGGREHWVNSLWRQRFAADADDPATAMRHISPAAHAAEVKIPVLLIHGRDDSVVPIEQSYTMRRELRNVGAEVELVELDDGDHWLTNASTRRAVYSSMLEFLDSHIGVQQ